MMFLLLTGSLPFGLGVPIAEIARAIKNGEPDWRLFRRVSTTAVSLCRRMLIKDDVLRPSAAECLRHPWFASPCAAESVPRTLSIGPLVQYHAQSKLQQVLMNLVAAELQVTKLKTVGPLFESIDVLSSGLLFPEQLKAAMSELGISPEYSEQVLQTLTDLSPSGKPAYGLFMSGCVDLVDDKLDHMLWKVFAMVDEDHSGEISAVVLEHFLQSAIDQKELGDSDVGNIQADIERYLCSVLDPKLTATELVSRICGERQMATFEDFKRYVITGMPRARLWAKGAGDEGSSPSPA